jgi:GNAT superfamily N-acetyltransferase
MAVQISRPRNDPEGLEELAPLWTELHGHHRQVADYQPLVADLELSWTSRLAWYRRLLADGGCYLTAHTGEGEPIGYAMVAVHSGPDDTFKVVGGLAEVVTLVVSPGHRSGGVGRALLEANGYGVAEHVLYRRLGEQ